MPTRHYDVAICGGGFAGLTLARQLRLQHPELSVALLDRLQRPLPEAAFKVGEAVTEAGAHYLAETLQLRDYFETDQLFKMGFRFFFGGGDGPLQQRPEFGLSGFPSLGSYTIDRGMFENDLRELNAEAGVAMLEGCSLEEIELTDGEQPHRVCFQDETGVTGDLMARWVVDATGRRRFLQRKLGLGKPPTKRCSATWFRLEGRVDVTDMVPAEEIGWHRRVPDGNRWYSVNHLMGTGYWVWIIPLASGHTSIGIVASEEFHPFEDRNTPERAAAWLRRHEPVLAAHIEGRAQLDFRCLRQYSRSSRQVFSPERWACVGDAAVFADPLYSPAVDLISLENLFLSEMIRLDTRKELTPAVVRHYDQTVLSLNDMLTRNIQVSYPLMASPVVMACKVIWDTAAGWSLLSPQVFNPVLLDPEVSARVRRVKGSYFFLTLRMQDMFGQWAERSSGRSTFEFIDFLDVPLLRDLRKRNLQGGQSEEQLIRDHRLNMERIEELALAVFLLAVEELFPDRLEQLESRPWLNAWGVGLDPARWRKDKLFEPTTEPRDLRPMRQHIRGLFRIEAAQATSASG